MKYLIALVLFCLSGLALNGQQLQSKLISESNTLLDQHFPYPVIFIHGLTSSSNTWLEIKGVLDAQEWTDGGILRFSLNGDNNLTTANINGANQTEVKDFNTNVSAADYYRIDFDCDPNGNLHTPASEASQSNQAAIYKQGLAVKKAINHVLTATGREKVILVGHSMGGLAARQYLQNPAIWVSPGKHKVAKVVTLGTPHGGSNATGLGLGEIVGSADEASEAIRDLRTTYWYSGNSGVFLFGGVENAATMNDWEDFHNLDVNCNGATGNTVIGLNQKAIDSKVDFSCVIGDYVISPYYNGYGDLLVGAFEAQVKNYTSGLTSESFDVTALHTELPNLISAIYESIDEPDDYERSYDIAPNEIYNAFFSEQAPDCLYSMDYDDFRFKLPSDGSVSISAWFTQSPPPPCGISILKDDGTSQPPTLYDDDFQSAQVNTMSVSLDAGSYFLEFYTDPTADSWGNPYAFTINSMVNTSETPAQAAPTLSVLDQPIGNTLRLQIDSISDGNLTIIDQMGRFIIQQNDVQSGTVQINTTDWPSGIYFASLRVKNAIITKKIVK